MLLGQDNRVYFGTVRGKTIDVKSSCHARRVLQTRTCHARRVLQTRTTPGPLQASIRPICATYWREVGTYSDISSIGLQQVNGRGTKMRREDFLLHRASIPTSSKLIKKRWRSVMVSFGTAKVLIMNYFLLW